MEPGQSTQSPSNPALSVSLLVDVGSGLIPILKPSTGGAWALPTARISAGELLEEAALRVGERLLGAPMELVHQLHAYSFVQGASSSEIRVVYWVRGWQQQFRPSPDCVVDYVHEMNLPNDLNPQDRQILHDHFLGRYSRG